MQDEIQIRKKESYTSLSLIKQCPYQYKLHYVDKIYKEQNSIALDVGNLCHKILEIQRDPRNKNKVNIDYLLGILKNGYTDENNSFESVIGIDKIKEKFFEDYIAKNEKSGLTYIDKIETFKKYINNYKEDEEWKTLAVELPFSLDYRGFELTGKIDRVDINSSGEYKVTDYKTANKVYDEKDLKTPLQMYVYALAIEKMFGKMPIEFEYDFVVLGEKRKAMSKGWENRGRRILDKIIDDKDAYYLNKDFPPKPSPLCYFCNYRAEECEYYSLWRPDDKTYEINKEYTPFSEPPKKNEFIW